MGALSNVSVSLALQPQMDKIFNQQKESLLKAEKDSERQIEELKKQLEKIERKRDGQKRTRESLCIEIPKNLPIQHNINAQTSSCQSSPHQDHKSKSPSSITYLQI